MLGCCGDAKGIYGCGTNGMNIGLYVLRNILKVDIFSDHDDL